MHLFQRLLEGYSFQCSLSLPHCIGYDGYFWIGLQTHFGGGGGCGGVITQLDWVIQSTFVQSTPFICEQGYKPVPAHFKQTHPGIFAARTDIISASLREAKRRSNLGLTYGDCFSALAMNCASSQGIFTYC